MSSRASRLTLALTVVGVAGAITIVHNMQTEERKRLHQGVIRDKAVLAEKEEERRNAGTTR